jgi:hypothetical protein
MPRGTRGTESHPLCGWMATMQCNETPPPPGWRLFRSPAARGRRAQWHRRPAALRTPSGCAGATSCLAQSMEEGPSAANAARTSGRSSGSYANGRASRQWRGISRRTTCTCRRASCPRQRAGLHGLPEGEERTPHVRQGMRTSSRSSETGSSEVGGHD